MLKKLFTNIWKQIAGLRKDCRGFVVMSTLAIFLFLFVLCASIYAVGETIHQRIKLQNACDAAAYSAAVVQADGLSRMAVVNRAMAWSYVQMTNRQMDYITYRWLKLTCKRFEEDLRSVKKYNAQLIVAVDKELGVWALLEALVSGIISKLANYDCAGRNGPQGPVYDVNHGQEGRGYWCGLEDYKSPPEIPRKEHRIHLNVAKNTDSDFLNKIKNAGSNYLSESIFNIDNISKAVNALGNVIDGNPRNEEKGHVQPNWGYRLGKLIDYDKKNIYRMNRALERINTQMEISMKMTAENVLKAMLKDNRYDSKSVLQDYYLSIHIPHAENPYNTEDENNSFFSPLHNTEADEMLFLNMQSANHAEKKLPQHFPVLLGGDSLAYGLDQWFIRGMGIYNKEQGKSDKEYAFFSVYDLSGVTLSGTKRNEGALGIQRVYKDTNLNETGAGFFATKRKKIIATHPEKRVRRTRRFRKEPQCCQDAAEKIERDPSVYLIHEHHIYEDLPDEKRAVDRGNHLMDFSNITSAIVNTATNFFSDKITSVADSSKSTLTNQKSEDNSSDPEITNMDELTSVLTDQRASYEEQLKNAETDDEKKAIQAKIDSLNKTIANPLSSSTNINTTGSLNSTSGSNPQKQFTGILLDGLNSVVRNILGQYLDIQPSCGNDPKMSYMHYPMCRSITDPTTALYSEYRWGSCKWYCLTKGWTYLVTNTLDLAELTGLSSFYKRAGHYTYLHMYCDYGKATIAKLELLLKTIDIKGKGWGHYGWPKWFCGDGPAYPGDDFIEKLPFDASSLLDWIPPFTLKGITGAKHGYMSNPLDFFDSEGFMTPIKPLWDKNCRECQRDDYNSCAMFPDGIGDAFPFYGLNAYPGLIRGHARIYADDKEIFDNRYVGAICKPWVLNERFFAGEGSIVVGAAMKHTNPFVQLFNFWNTEKKKDAYATGTETQENAEKTVLSAFNIPEGNYMWTMSAARAGVRHRRRNGEFDQERQYQITYDSTSDAENLTYKSGPYVKAQDGNGWTSPEEWDSSYNEHALSRIYFPGQEQSPVWNGCPCGANSQQFKNMWNLCETDWDATLLPLRYAGQKASLYLEKEENEDHVNEQHDAFNSKNYSERRNLLGDTDHYKKIGNGKYWVWNGVATDNSSVLMSDPFISSVWKPANLLKNDTGIPAAFFLQNKVPTGKEEKMINIFLKDKIL